MNRRDFLKKSAIAGGAVAGVAATTQILNPMRAEAIGFNVKHHKSIDDIMKFSSDYKRFEQKHTAFNISAWGDPTWMLSPFPQPVLKYPVEGQDTMDEHVVKYMSNGMTRNMSGGAFMTEDEKSRPGYTQLDFAAANGAIGNLDLSGAKFSGFFSNESGPFFPLPDGAGGTRFVPTNAFAAQFPVPMKVKDSKYQFESKKDASYAVKKMAKMYGADLVGITPYDERFVYESEVFAPINPMTLKVMEPMFNVERPVDLETTFGFKPKSVVVFAIEMDYEALKTSPSVTSKAPVYIGYDKTLTIGARITAFLKELGYNSRTTMNDTALSIPLAIAAGLGEGSRMGLLITDEFGPRVRIGKIFTELELDYDGPITFGVKEFCEVCMKCSDGCPSDSISKLSIKDPENKVRNRSNNGGVEKWYNDGQRCLSFWSENHTACSNCITVCPYNKLDEWHHDFAKIATKIPIVNNVARYLDELFGYGEIDSDKYSSDFWKKNI